MLTSDSSFFSLAVTRCALRNRAALQTDSSFSPLAKIFFLALPPALWTTTDHARPLQDHSSPPGPPALLGPPPRSQGLDPGRSGCATATRRPPPPCSPHDSLRQEPQAWTHSHPPARQVSPPVNPGPYASVKPGRTGQDGDTGVRRSQLSVCTPLTTQMLGVRACAEPLRAEPWPFDTWPRDPGPGWVTL